MFVMPWAAEAMFVKFSLRPICRVMIDTLCVTYISIPMSVYFCWVIALYISPSVAWYMFADSFLLCLRQVSTLRKLSTRMSRSRFGTLVAKRNSDLFGGTTSITLMDLYVYSFFFAIGGFSLIAFPNSMFGICYSRIWLGYLQYNIFLGPALRSLFIIN